MRIPMDIGIGHYDLPPPDRLSPADLDILCAEDRFRFANHLSAWIEVKDGHITDAGYDGRALVGSTQARLGITLRIAGVSFPLLQADPVIGESSVRFVQTAGGRTGAPFPRRIDRPPYVRLTSPPAWTTLALTIAVDGSSSFELVGASQFPRHWIFDSSGALVAKSGLIDFTQWTRVDEQVQTPWHDYERAALMASVESQVEHNLSPLIMSSQPEMVKVPEGSSLIEQGAPGGFIYLILDGMLEVTVDGTMVAELGPGAIVGEMALLEGGHATATVKALTPVRAAKLPGEALNLSDLRAVAAAHRREISSRGVDST
ncbi:MAG TPA: cyclic nucleotide-binding domain-containing protein [Acidimicrobiia bacterium]|nr:cyclic nucleotide-binding domain-containing protein [Acidimicrobiia bacterium]